MQFACKPRNGTFLSLQFIFDKLAYRCHIGFAMDYAVGRDAAVPQKCGEMRDGGLDIKSAGNSA